MKSFPVWIARQQYRGADARKRAKVAERNRVAAGIEEHINADLERQPPDSVTVYASYAIASALREDDALVHAIIHATDAGANGITILKGDYARAMARLNGSDER